VIEIQQALFGYRDGHNLVASSVPLLTRERLLLAKVTDSSGPDNLPGFESVITGLPVSDSGYAFFCTWRAPEMPRPGCVWSHVLLIEFDDLDRIEDLSMLRKLFVRPASHTDFSGYTCSLVIAPSALAPSSMLPSAEKAEAVTNALYGHPEEDVVILDDSSAGWDDAILAIWSQQWNSLRRCFSFSTASLGDRRVGGVPCTIQVVPASKGRVWRKPSSATFVLELHLLKRNPELFVKSDWTDIVVAELTTGLRGFRSFLNIFAEDVPPLRSLFSPLAAIYIQFQSKSQGRRTLLEYVGRVFPKRSHGALLKKNLLSGAQLGPENEIITLLENVEFILGCDEAKAYDLTDFDFKGVSSILWEHARSGLLKLLSRQLAAEPSQPLAEMLGAASLNVDISTLQDLAQNSPILIPALIRYNWELAAEVEIWSFNAEIQSKVFEVLAGLSLDTRQWASVMGAMFVAATPVCIRESIERSGSEVIFGTYRWLDSLISEQMLPSSLWRTALADSAEDAVARGTCNGPAQLALMAWLAAPWRILNVPGLDHRIDVHFQEGAMTEVPRPLRLATSFLLLAVALRSGGKAHLITQSLFTVHESLASGGYAHESWDMIAPYLPDLSWWKSWDRCERLRRAVHHYYQAHPRECASLIRAAANPTERELAHIVTK